MQLVNSQTRKFRDWQVYQNLDIWEGTTSFQTIFQPSKKSKKEEGKKKRQEVLPQVRTVIVRSY